jgi:hypothetical protein
VLADTGCTLLELLEPTVMRRVFGDTLRVPQISLASELYRAAARALRQSLLLTFGRGGHNEAIQRLKYEELRYRRSAIENVKYM